MSNEAQDRAEKKPESEKPAEKSLFQDIKEGMSDFVDRQKKYFQSNENVITASFGNLTLTENAGDGKAEKVDSMVARNSSTAEKSEAVKEAQATLVKRESSQEEKLRAANEMAKEGQTSFTGPDGRRYDVSMTEAAGRTVISVHTSDGAGNSHPVLRGYVDKDGNVFKQKDADGKEVPYEGSWASRNLKDSPLVGSNEKSAPVPVSAENEHLKKTLKDTGISPAHQTPAERIELAKQHSQLSGDVDNQIDRIKAVQRQVDAKNRPLQEELDHLNAQSDKFTEKIREISKDMHGRNEKLVAELKDKGIGDGTKVDLEKPAAVTSMKEKIDGSNLTPEEKKKYKDELTAIEKRHAEMERVSAQSDKLIPRTEAISDKIYNNGEALSNEQVKLREMRKELRENENKLAESKFTDDLKEIDKLPKEQREGVYKALEQIAHDGGGAPNKLSPEQRKQLVMDTAHQIANTDSIKQGNKGTCGLASCEVELAKSHPDKYAQYIADLATKGVATTADGGQLKIQPDLINHINKKGEFGPHDDGNPERSLASKIFQSSAATRVLEGRMPNDSPVYDTQRPGAKYPIEVGEVNPSGKGDVHTADDTGERIVKKDGTVTKWDGVDSDEISKLTSELTGEKYEAKPIVKGRDLSNPEQAAAAEKEFIDAAEKNGLPMKVSITMKRGDFTGMNNEGGHELIVTRIEKGPPSMVYYDNTAGGTDHNYPTGRPVPLNEFLKAMQETKMSDGNTHVEGYVITKKN